MLAGELPTLEVERVAVAVVRRIPEHADATVVLRPAHLAIVGDVAPYQIAPLRAPRRALGPQETGVQTLDRRVGLRDGVELRVDCDDVRVPEIGGRRAARTEIARRIGDGRRRCRWPGLRCRAACPGHYGAGAGRE